MSTSNDPFFSFTHSRKKNIRRERVYKNGVCYYDDPKGILQFYFKWKIRLKENIKAILFQNRCLKFAKSSCEAFFAQVPSQE